MYSFIRAKLANYTNIAVCFQLVVYANIKITSIKRNTLPLYGFLPSSKKQHKPGVKFARNLTTTRDGPVIRTETGQ